MAYATQERNRAATLAAVGVLHTGVIYALVVGLAGPVWQVFETPPLVGEQIALPKPPPDEVKPATPEPDQAIRPIKDPTDGRQVVDVKDIFDDAGDTIFPTAGGGSGGGTIEPPLPPQPPQPPVQTYTPKAATPRGASGTWVTPNDYPAADLRAGREGTTAFRLSIAADGKVLRCEIVKSSGFASLDDTACARLTSRGRFAPATDATGAKAIGTYSGKVHWKLPKDY